jgi:hypothetical protein
MKRLNLTLALVAAALLALSGIAVAKDRHGDDHGRHHHHHHRHDFPIGEAGTISSFDATTGRLTIALTGGETIGGLVTEDTRIRCEGADDRLARRDHGGDDNGGRGEAEPGDDDGGRFESGDDHGDDGAAGEAATPTEVPPPPAAAEATCSPASLTAGEIVGSAELRLEGGRAVFEEIELGFHS